jgi:hypothetical protein
MHHLRIPMDNVVTMWQLAGSARNDKGAEWVEALCILDDLCG